MREIPQRKKPGFRTKKKKKKIHKKSEYITQHFFHVRRDKAAAAAGGADRTTPESGGTLGRGGTGRVGRYAAERDTGSNTLRRHHRHSHRRTEVSVSQARRR